MFVISSRALIFDGALTANKAISAISPYILSIIIIILDSLFTIYINIFISLLTTFLKAHKLVLCAFKKFPNDRKILINCTGFFEVRKGCRKLSFCFICQVI